MNEQGLNETWTMLRKMLGEGNRLIDGHNRLEAILQSYGWTDGVDEFIRHMQSKEAA